MVTSIEPRSSNEGQGQLPPWSGLLKDEQGPLLSTAEVLENAIDFAGGRMEIVRYDWPRSAEASWSIGPDYYFVKLYLSGGPNISQTGHLGLNIRETRDRVGRILIVPPDSRLHTAFSQGTQRCLNCFLEASKFETILGQPARWTDASLDHALAFSSTEIEWLLRKLYDEVRHGGFSSEMMVENLTNTLVIEIIRQLGLARNTRQDRHGGLAQWRLRLLRELIHAEGPKPPLSELAKKCNLSVRHLCRAFKEETGKTLKAYIGEVTIDQAQSMLSDSEYTIGEIAQRLGYSSSASFGYTFRKATGLRPKDVRRGRLARAPSS